jgi:thiamine pyrophosphate-dependent acetolactate synthase large subunit-like protein
VAAFDTVSGIRPVLGLFEGCCSGAADGYGRMTGTPAMTMFHLGPGLGNAVANLHNARRARTPVFNVIGNHASWHLDADAPLTMDIAALAATVSQWTRTSGSVKTLSQDTAQGISAANQGAGAALILPQDIQWESLPDPDITSVLPRNEAFHMDAIETAAGLLKSKQALWTQAREHLNITTLLCANRSHKILEAEFYRAQGHAADQNALSLMTMNRPDIDWVAVSQGMGVPAEAADTAEEMADAFTRALAKPGPKLIQLNL